MWTCLWVLHCIAPLVNARSRGLLLLYHPKDVSHDCVISHRLRFDLSFGMGMSDTLTLVFRNLKDIDYECQVEIVTENVHIVIVIHFPNSIASNCARNENAVIVMKKQKCFRICEQRGDRDSNSPYYIVQVKDRFRFRYLSNSSINTDMDASIYQVTATAARKAPQDGCNQRNESLCIVQNDEFCFTSGVDCDGIKNCGVTDWFDERKAYCLIPSAQIGYAPLIAVIAVILCFILAASHLIVRYLPPLTSSFFIFNANEDNRLCIDSISKPPDTASAIEKAKRISLIPVYNSSSDSNSYDGRQSLDLSSSDQDKQNSDIKMPGTTEPVVTIADIEEPTTEDRRTKMKLVADMFHQRLRNVTDMLRSTQADGSQNERSSKINSAEAKK